MTCWDNPEACYGCHYCASTLDPSLPDLDPITAHRLDTEEALRRRGGVLIDGVWRAPVGLIGAQS